MLAGSSEKIQQGLEMYGMMRAYQVRRYLGRLRWATIEREERLNSTLRSYIQTPEEAPA